MSGLFKAAILGLLTALLGSAVSLTPFGVALEENLGLHLLFKLRGTRQPPGDVVIVGIDDMSAVHLNLPKDPAKWSRSHHARLIDTLVNAGAAVIAFDLMFNEARASDHDRAFAEAIRQAHNVVLFEYLRSETVRVAAGGSVAGDVYIETRTSPLPLLADAAAALAPFPLPKVPVRVNWYWTFKTAAGETPTLPVVAFQLFALGVYDEFHRLLEHVSPSHAAVLPPHREAALTAAVDKFVSTLRDFMKHQPLVAQRMLEALEQSETFAGAPNKRQLLRSLIRMYQSGDNQYLNFYGPPGTITTVPYHQALYVHESSLSSDHRPDFRGKAVFVGLSEQLRPEQKDGFYTVFSQANGIDLSGVEIAATAFANLLEDAPIRTLPFHQHLTMIATWGVVLGLLCRSLPTLAAISGTLGLSAVYLAVASHQFKTIGMWPPLLIPLLFQMPLALSGAVLWKYFDTNRERKHIRRLFGYYVPDKAIDQLLINKTDVRKSNQLVYGICLYTDAEQYTTLAEHMDPKDLSNFINQYYEAVFMPVHRYGGIISDVVGDSMLAIWATADPDAAPRQRACLAALEIASAVQRFNQDRDDIRRLPTRIGVHIGHMVLGHIGAISHYEYRAVGDIVNAASRLQGLNKYLGTRILVSEAMLDQVEGVLTRELGAFVFVGKTKPLVVYELLCREVEAHPQQRRLCADFAVALDAYRRRSWNEAIAGFQGCLKRYGEDGPSRFYLQLCEQYRESRLEESWDGIVRLMRK